ncbi:unnamed protein product [Clavelina lepadiformis]|uniref:Uncharacterized protein n=1 Tax=Clavelina lepadiformis TaxID=159417 RepID=A0ABP0GQX0_CLALP
MSRISTALLFAFLFVLALAQMSAAQDEMSTTQNEMGSGMGSTEQAAMDPTEQAAMDPTEQAAMDPTEPSITTESTTGGAATVTPITMTILTVFILAVANMFG